MDLDFRFGGLPVLIYVLKFTVPPENERHTKSKREREKMSVLTTFFFVFLDY